MKTLDLPPNAPMLMEATRAIGYSLESAVADIIDNSVAASATEVDIEFFPFGDSYVAILDNGTGMDVSQLTAAMRFGCKNPMDSRDSSDLGRFGLGLKTASLSQCRKLTVVSYDGKAVSGAQWDLDYVATSNSWALQVLDGEDMASCPLVQRLLTMRSGTLVIWRDLDRMRTGESDFDNAMAKRMDRVREHVSLVFHRYLAGESGIRRLQIRLNNVPLHPNDPFLLGHSTQIMDDEVINIEDQKVVVRPYILPHISKLTSAQIQALGGEDGFKRQQGFYVYRNRRLLVWGTWYRLVPQGDLSKLARVRVDVPNSLDHLWRLDIKKSAVALPEIVRKNLAIVTDKIVEASKRTWSFRGRKENEDSRVHMWNRNRTREGIVYQINRDHPLVEAAAGLNSGSKILEHLLIQIERALPLNSLFLDFSCDQKIQNDEQIPKAQLTHTIRDLLVNQPSGSARRMLSAELEKVEPFSHYPELITEVLQEVEHI